MSRVVSAFESLREIVRLFDWDDRYGKIGLTCIENSPEAAKALYERIVTILVAAATEGRQD